MPLHYLNSSKLLLLSIRLLIEFYLPLLIILLFACYQLLSPYKDFNLKTNNHQVKFLATPKVYPTLTLIALEDTRLLVLISITPSFIPLKQYKNIEFAYIFLRLFNRHYYPKDF